MKNLPLILAAAYVVYRLRKATSSGHDPGTSTGDIRPGALSYSPNNYIAWADALETALGGSTINENEEQIYDIMGLMLVDADYHQLVRAYGVRCTLLGWVNCLSLPQAIERYLSTSERAIINGFFRSNGMTVTV